MPPDQLLVDRAQGVGDGEASRLVEDLGQEDGFKHVVAEFLAERIDVVAFDGVDDLVGFLEDVAGEAARRLLAIPRAALGRPQGAHDLDQPRELAAGGRVCRDGRGQARMAGLVG